MREPQGAPERPAGLSGPDDGHRDCRIREFARWNRVMLEHERGYLSRQMLAVAFRPEAESQAILHEITDIDWLLQYHERRVRA